MVGFAAQQPLWFVGVVAWLSLHPDLASMCLPRRCPGENSTAALQKRNYPESTLHREKAKGQLTRFGSFMHSAAKRRLNVSQSPTRRDKKRARPGVCLLHLFQCFASRQRPWFCQGWTGEFPLLLRYLLGNY
ncbi:hypothetical protein QBC38DRAFT_41435 [Podospora fimiseda]|uniref:Secreted protein n=1 Tax=Podospora fimiseda TaxID=252190 RepID=A0AAN7H005_9PEZI|nr:hypothetical protein QBC38DRAFT_41435 [Podospora fimiseda]